MDLTASLAPVLDARAQFVALCCGCLPICGARGPARGAGVLPCSPSLLGETLGRPWVVRPAAVSAFTVATTLSRGGCTTDDAAHFHVFLGVSCTLGVVHSCVRSDPDRGRATLATFGAWCPGRGRARTVFTASYCCEDSWVTLNHVDGRTGAVVGTVARRDDGRITRNALLKCNSKWLVMGLCFKLLVCRLGRIPGNNGNGDYSCGGDGDDCAVEKCVCVELGPKYSSEWGCFSRLRDDEFVLACAVRGGGVGDPESGCVLFVDLPASYAAESIVIARQVDIPPSPVGVVWKGTTLCTLHRFPCGILFDTDTLQSEVIQPRGEYEIEVIGPEHWCVTHPGNSYDMYHTADVTRPALTYGYYGTVVPTAADCGYILAGFQGVPEPSGTGKRVARVAITDVMTGTPIAVLSHSDDLGLC